MEKIDCNKCTIKDICKIPKTIKELEEIIEYLLEEYVLKSNKNS